jgi:uncharacterized protein (TIGR02466 family)
MSLKVVGTEMLFASPLSVFELPDAAELNAGILAAARAMRNSEPGVSISNQLGWHSGHDFFLRPEPCFQALGQQIVQALMHIAGEDAATRLPGFNLQTHDIEGQGWININGQGAFNTPHDHAGFQWSGCYYAAVPETSQGRSGQIEFLDSRGGLNGNTLPGSRVYATKFQVRPYPGLLLIFPSYLRHWVYPNLEDAERISIAFNAKIVTRAQALPQAAAA